MSWFSDTVSDWWDKTEELVVDTTTDTIKDLINADFDDIDDLQDIGSAHIEALTGVNFNIFTGTGGENDFFEKVWTDRTMNELEAMFKGEYTTEDFLNPGSAFWNPAGQIADPGNFLDKESVDNYMSGNPEMRDVISAMVAGGFVASAFSGTGAAAEAAAAEGAESVVLSGSGGISATGVEGAASYATIADAAAAGVSFGDIAEGIAIGVSTIGSVYQAYQTYEAQGDAEDAAKAAAALELLMTNEQVANLEEENARTLSTARARAGASGISGASTEIYIDALKTSGEDDVQWLKDVGIANYDMKIDEGDAASNVAESQMWGYVGQGLTNAISLFT